MAGAHHSCPAPSDSSGSSSIPKKGQDDRDQVVSTQDQVVSTLETFPENFLANLGQCVDTRSSSVDTRGLPRTPFGLIWNSVSTLDQVVSTREALPEKTYRSSGTRKHISCSDLRALLINL
ncbi:hypothetical protein Taro_039184 [Colocasia esculenta]|uniref:Uncharacterized protein n=1 Tax=Colocasia esculenta TaxID=4460 RepID=A0A843W5P0_COLES|nr:hypothetical protein [Colocasia esculenta]